MGSNELVVFPQRGSPLNKTVASCLPPALHSEPGSNEAVVEKLFSVSVRRPTDELHSFINGSGIGLGKASTCGIKLSVDCI